MGYPRSVMKIFAFADQWKRVRISIFGNEWKNSRNFAGTVSLVGYFTFTSIRTDENRVESLLNFTSLYHFQDDDRVISNKRNRFGPIKPLVGVSFKKIRWVLFFFFFFFLNYLQNRMYYFRIGQKCRRIFKITFMANV